MHEQIPMQLWMLVPREERLVLAEALQIPRTGVSEIRDNEVISDGHSNEDLRTITRELMAAYVGEPTDTALTFPRLWELTCAKARSVVNPPQGVMTSKGGVVSVGDVPAAVDLSQFKEVSNEEFAALTKPKTTKNAKGTKAK